MSVEPKLEPKEAFANSPLTVEQWQGLARLADVIQALESGLGTDLGGDLVKNLGRWTAALDGDIPTTLRAAAETLTTLHQSGVLSQLQMVLKMVSQVPEFWQEVVPQRLMQWSQQASDIDWSSLVDLGAEASKMKTLAGMMGFLRYLGDADESRGLLEQVTDFAQRASTLATPELLKALPAYADLLVEMAQSGLLDRILDFLAYFQGFSATIHPVAVIGVVLDYLQSTDFIEQVRQIRPNNLARLAAAASDPDTADVMTKGLRAIGMLKHTDLVGHVLNEGLRISSMMLDQEFLDTLPELLDTATMLHRSGLLAAMRKLMLAFPQLYHLPWDEYFTAMIGFVDQLEVQDLAAKINAASEDTRKKSAHLGGMGGMMRLMRDKQTQMMLQFAVSLGSQLLPIDRHSEP